MNGELIDEVSGIEAIHERERMKNYPKVRFVDALVTTFIFETLALYVVIGGYILIHHLY